MHLITIGIPTYNRSDLLEKALESVQKQTCQNFCVLISDNCSDEKHQKRNRELVDIFKEKFDISYTVHPQNLGAGYNFWSLIEKAETEYFCFLSDDDRFAPTYLETCLTKFSELNENYVAVAGEAQYFYGDKIYDFFAEGVEWYDTIPITSKETMVFERIMHCIMHPYGDIFYSLYKTNAIKTKLAEYIFKNNTTGMEITFHISTALSGDRIVTKEVILYKHATENIVKYARWQALGSFRGFLNLREALASAKGLRRERKEIASVLSRAPISQSDRDEILCAHEKYSRKFVLTKITGYKDKKC